MARYALGAGGRADAARVEPAVPGQLEGADDARVATGLGPRGMRARDCRLVSRPARGAAAADWGADRRLRHRGPRGRPRLDAHVRIAPTSIVGLMLVEGHAHRDERGEFARLFCERELEE